MNDLQRDRELEDSVQAVINVFSWQMAQKLKTAAPHEVDDLLSGEVINKETGAVVGTWKYNPPTGLVKVEAVKSAVLQK